MKKYPQSDHVKNVSRPFLKLINIFKRLYYIQMELCIGQVKIVIMNCVGIASIVIRDKKLDDFKKTLTLY